MYRIVVKTKQNLRKCEVRKDSMKIKINDSIAIEVADTYLYKISVKGFPYPVLWSEEYAKQQAGWATEIDSKNPKSVTLTGDVTERIYKAIKAIKALVKCGELEA